jgi:hypothetical protein
VLDPFVEQFDPAATVVRIDVPGTADHGIRRCPHEVTIGAF